MADRIFGLDLMRAIAVAIVVLAHFTLFLDNENFHISDEFAPLGVEVFFVLSGFLIGGIWLRLTTSSDWAGWQTIRNFWGRRWLRTLPNYYLYLALYAFIIPASLRRGDDAPWHYWFFLQNLTDKIPDFFIRSWSLAVEEWFYLLLPLLAAFFMLAKLDGKRGTTGAALTLIILPTAARLAMPATMLPDLEKAVLFRLDAIGYGVLMAVLYATYKNKLTPQLRKRLWFLGLSSTIALFLYYGLVMGGSSEYSALERLWPTLTGVALAIQLPFLANWRVQNPTPIHGAIQRLSLYSYSLYLCHPIPIGALEYVLKGAGGDWFLYGAGIVVAIAVSAANYHFFELPILRLRDSKLARRKAAEIA